MWPHAVLLEASHIHASQVFFVPSFTNDERAALLNWGFAGMYMHVRMHAYMHNNTCSLHGR
jgi:hypothetical protein